MGSITRRPGKRTVYLDTSALSYAFRGGHSEFRSPDDPPEFVDLFALVGCIARDCNLCVSTMHIVELAQGDERAASALFSWLDSLDLVWMYSFDKVGDREDEHALQRVVGVEPEAIDAFAPSMLAAFTHWRFDSLSEVLSRRSALHGLAEGARIRGRENEHRLIDEMVRRYHFDRNLDPETRAMTDDQKAATTARKRRAILVEDAALAYTRLRGRSLPEFHARYRALQSPHEAFADFVLANPTALPTYFMSDAFSTAFVEVMARRTPNSKGARKLRSSFHDYAHLSIGAAYCDVFTCDGLTGECLGDAPTKIGRSLPIVYQNHDAAGFVRALETAVGR